MSNRISQQHLVVELSQCLSKRKSKSESSLPNATAHFHDEASSYEYEKHKNRTFVEPPVPAIPITQTESILSSKSPLLPNFSRIKENTERHPVAVPTRSVDSVLEQPTERKINTHCSCVSKWTPDVTVKIDILAIVWFHPNLNRHQAEAELRNAEEGVYLLRPRMEGGTCEGYCLGVRSSHVVKHYKITVENGDLVLGQDRFSNLESLEEHFDSHPILGDENDAKVVCRHPYPREIDELHDYQFLSNHFIPTPSRRRMIENATKPRAFSLVSKEGFLVKMGGRVKSWKRRWFVLRDTNLHYYTAVKDTKPIKTISLEEVTKVSPCDVPARLNTFQLVLPMRTFFMQAPSMTNMEDWIYLIQFKLNENTRFDGERKDINKSVSSTW